MPNFAQVTLIGHLGSDPETRPVGSDSVCSFSLATSRKRQDREVTTWWQCAAWGKRGEIVQRYLRKGDPIQVVGEPQNRPWTDRDGHERLSLEVVVSQVTLLGGSGGAQGAPGASGESPPKRRPATARDGAQAASQSFQAPGGGADYDDDIPFEAYQARWVA